MPQPALRSNLKAYFGEEIQQNTVILMNKKLLYEQPTVDVFTLQAEGVVCASLTTIDSSIDPGISDDWGELL